MLFMTFDITISCMAANRQKKDIMIFRLKSSRYILDNMYPDKYLDKVYNNKEEIK